MRAVSWTKWRTIAMQPIWCTMFALELLLRLLGRRPLAQEAYREWVWAATQWTRLGHCRPLARDLWSRSTSPSPTVCYQARAAEVEASRSQISGGSRFLERLL